MTRLVTNYNPFAIRNLFANRKENPEKLGWYTVLLSDGTMHLWHWNGFNWGAPEWQVTQKYQSDIITERVLEWHEMEV